MNLLLVAAASLAVVSCASLSMEDQEFHAWKLKFGKVYRSPEEEARRKDIWLSTRRTVLAHNILADQGIKTYRMGMNHLSDLDELEYMTLYGSLPEDPINGTDQHDVISFTPQDGAALPASLDWRTTGCVTPVQQQGVCGSCWAFTAVAAVESHTCIRHRRSPIPLSEQQLVDCAKAYGCYGCRGGNLAGAFQHCVDNGIVVKNFYPYRGQESQCPFSYYNPIPQNRIGGRCSSYVYVQGNEPGLQRAVAQIGPVGIQRIPMHPSFHHYHSGVYYEPNCHLSPPNNAHHAMLVVGYGTDKRYGDYWLVKNSHGTLWGEQGYIRMARNRNNNCGIASQPVYPVVM